MKFTTKQLREKRHTRIRSKVNGTAARPRLSISRSLNNISAQLIDDETGKVLVSSSSLKSKKGKKTDVAKEVGLDIAKKAIAIKVTACVFDRGGYLYHGRVKSLADGAREGGLQF